MGELIGRQLGQYRIDALLGEGNMGSVYQAQDLNLARKVVLKVMHRQLASQETFQQRFAQEAQAAARLDHPSIVRIYNFETTPSLYMVMEYVSGPALGDYVRHQRSPNDVVNLDTTLRLIAQVADALDYAHAQGVVHRDIKPSNILLKPLSRPDREGDPALRAVVTDFGLAKLLDGGMQTVLGTFMGTLSYMSPEQCLGRDLDGRSDIYSLGILLYQLATGQLPFNVKSPTDAIRMHVKELPPAPRMISPGLPSQTEQVIVQAIAKNPASRFQTGGQMAEALRRAAWALVGPGETQTFALGHGHHREGTGTGLSVLPTDQLLIYHAGEAPRVMGLAQDVVKVGRGQENDVILAAKGISRNHLRIERALNGWQAIDLDSTNGSYLDKLRLPPHQPTTWPAGMELHIGSYALQWQKVRSHSGAGNSSGSDEEPEESVQPRITSPGEIGLTIDPPMARVEPGNTLHIQCMAVNRGPVVEHLNIRVEGLPGEQVTFSDPLMRLMPGARGFMRITIKAPREASATSGETPFDVVATPLSNPEAECRARCDFVLLPFSAPELRVEPRRVRHRGKLVVEIANKGNRQEAYELVCGEPDAPVICQPYYTRVTLEPGQQRDVVVQVVAAIRPIFSTPAPEPVLIRLQQDGESIRSVPAMVEIPPKIPRGLWLLLLFLLGLAVILIGIWFLMQ